MCVKSFVRGRKKKKKVPGAMSHTQSAARERPLISVCGDKGSRSLFSCGRFFIGHKKKEKKNIVTPPI